MTSNIRAMALVTLAVCSLASGAAHAATQAVLGKKLQVKDTPGHPTKRRVSATAQEPGSANTVVGNPMATGATLQVIANGGTDSNQTFDLPSSGWSPIGSLGYKWSNRNQPPTPVRSASIKRTARGTFRLKIDINAASGTVDIVPESRNERRLRPHHRRRRQLLRRLRWLGGRRQQAERRHAVADQATDGGVVPGVTRGQRAVESRRSDQRGDALVEVVVPATTSPSAVAVDGTART
jgi:hypothetical protein